jgi:hypothetical protein
MAGPSTGPDDSDDHPPALDPVLGAREIERCAARGAKSIAFSEFPPALGLPSIHDEGRFWDPVFSAAHEADLPFSIHIGSSSRMPNTSADAPRVIMSVLLSWTSATTCVDWVFSQAFTRFPNLRITLSEGGIGWVPFMLERMSWVVEDRKFLDRFRMKLTDTGVEVVGANDGELTWPHGDLQPRDVFQQHVRGCFIAKFSMARETIDALGSEMFLAETDYPHSDSTYPDTMKQFDKLLTGLSLGDQFNLRQGNAMDWYRLDRDRLVAIEAGLVGSEA